MNTPLLVLVGVSGAGKTSIGRPLIDTLGVDLPGAGDTVENTLGVPIAELVIRNAPGFTEARRNAVLKVLMGPGAVVTLDASQIEDEQALRTLHDTRAQGTRVVKLSVKISKLMRRQGLNAPRSLALSASRAQPAMIMKTLRARYLDVAGSSVQIGGRKPRQVAGLTMQECRLTGGS